jgi:hypothetical protein
MKSKFIFLSLTLGLSGLAAIGALAAEWVPFFNHPKTNTIWVYDSQGIYYYKESNYLLDMITVRDKNFPKVWFKSTQPGKERRLVIEMDCKNRSGSLYDDTGNGVYADQEVDYLYGHQFKPDSVLMALYEEVCLSKSEKEKEQKQKDQKAAPPTSPLNY